MTDNTRARIRILPFPQRSAKLAMFSGMVLNIDVWDAEVFGYIYKKKWFPPARSERNQQKIRCHANGAWLAQQTTAIISGAANHSQDKILANRLAMCVL